jgi:hypothetical protein
MAQDRSCRHEPPRTEKESSERDRARVLLLIRTLLSVASREPPVCDISHSISWIRRRTASRDPLIATPEWNTVPSANPVFAYSGRWDAHSGDGKYSTCYRHGQRVDCLPSCVIGGSDHETLGPQVAADQKNRGEALLPSDVSATSSSTTSGGGVVLKAAVTAGSVTNHDLSSTALRKGCFHGPRGTTPVRTLSIGSGNCSSFCWVSFRVVKRNLQHCVFRRSPTRATERKA